MGPDGRRHGKRAAAVAVALAAVGAAAVVLVVTLVLIDTGSHSTGVTVQTGTTP